MQMTEHDHVNVLDIDHVYSILEYLQSRDDAEVLATDLRQVMPNYGRMMTIVRQLESEGLVCLKEEKRPRKRFLVSLTSKGRTVARKLTELDAFIKNWQK